MALKYPWEKLQIEDVDGINLQSLQLISEMY